jgi:hypothetical protein
MIVTVGGKPGAIGATIPSRTPISAEMGGVTSAWAFYGVNTQPVGHEPGLNLIAGPYIAIVGVDNPAKSRVDITISGQAPPGQTPWLSQIDAANHSLINLDYLQFKDGGSAAILSNAAPISISSGQALFMGAKGNIYVSSGASLTQRLSIDTAGHVAINAADDGAIVLSAAGRIRSSSGGFVFPDNTTQITAAVAGITSVTASAPLASSGGTAPNITMTSPLPIANGGTGSAAPSLVAGANVTITGSWPNQTIAATGGGGGSQTPWLSDIDGASHNLLNAASVGATAGASLALKTSALSRLSIDTQGHVSIGKPDAGAATSLLVADEIRVTTTGANANVVVYGPAGSNRNLLFGDTVNGVRWSFACDNSAETGGNIGSAFFIARWSDAGGYIDAPLYISRNDGTVTVKALYTSGQINANKVVLASGGSLQFGDGTIQTTAATGSGGSQTPWTQNINAASFQLLSVSKVGIGTASPGYPLDIIGAAGQVRVATATSGTPDFRIYVGGAGIAPAFQFNAANLTSAVAIGMGLPTGSITSGDMVFATYPGSGGWLEKMRLTNAGNFGIGTAAPGFRLETQGGRMVASGNNEAYGFGVRYSPSSSTGRWMGEDSAGNFLISTWGGTAQVIITPGSNVGIGAIAPTALLHVLGSVPVPGSAVTTQSNVGASLLLTDSNATTGSGGQIIFGAGNDAWRFASIRGYATNGGGNCVGDLVFYARRNTTDTAFTEAMRITSAGFLGIANSAPQFQLDVTGNGRVSASLESTSLYANLYWNGSAWVYRTAGAGLLSIPDASGYALWFAPNGSAGAAANPIVMMRITNANNVGFGTNVPGNAFVVSKNTTAPRAMSYSDGIQYVGADGQMAQISLDAYGSQGGFVNFRCASGTNAAPGAVVASQILGQVNAMGWNGSGYAQSACIQFVSQANWNTANTATSIVFDVTRQSTTGIFEVMRISAAGQGCVGIQQAAPAYPLEMGVDTAMKTATSTWLVASDIRLKRNVRNLEGGLSVIRKLRPVEAEYNGLANTIDGQRVVSFVADEVRSIVPHAVGSARRRLRKDDADETDVLDLNIHEILMHAILAIQQLAAAQPALRSS